MAQELPISNVLVTGSEGYLGSVIAPMLADAGFAVVGMDVGWYAGGALVPMPRRVRVIPRDVRDAEALDLRGFDAIVHLAALSNDPLGELDPALTMEINHHATVRLARIARGQGVRRFVFSSSCSIYGDSGGGDAIDESAPMLPLTAYAKSKVLAENDLADLATDDFRVTFLRNGTAFGISPRQRFDVVLPNLAGCAQVHGEIRLTSDGSPWRPLVHVEDIGRAVVASLQAGDRDFPDGPVNVGRSDMNHQVRDIAAAVGRAFPRCPVTLGPAAGPDRRTYRVSFRRIEEELPGFDATWTLDAGAEECARVFARVGLDRATFEDPRYTRLAMLRRLIDTGRLDEDLRPGRVEAVA
jgi:nucleoside-diphosphate-sugar epimerase